MTPWPKDFAHRKLTGVCAGIANGLGLSRVTVRVVALMALILMPPLALAGFTVLAMLLVSGVFVLFGALAGMFALIIKLAPWLLVLLVVCWFISSRRKQANTYR